MPSVSFAAHRGTLAKPMRRAARVNLFLVGAAKAGTSSLWAALRTHSEIFAPADELYKEPAFFTPIARNIGLDGYHAIFAAAADQRYLLDASTAYLTHPGAAQEIQAYNPEARVIAVLRNPADRAHSLYCWMVAEGYEWVTSFEAAIALEERRARTPGDRVSMPNYFWNYMYKRSGLYSEQVQRYRDAFGDRLLIVDFAELVMAPDRVLAQVQDFLDLPQERLILPRENPARGVISPQLSCAMRHAQQRLTNRFPHVFGGTKRRRDILVRAAQGWSRPPKLRPETRAKLNAFFAPDLDLLALRHGVDLRPE